MSKLKYFIFFLYTSNVIFIGTAMADTASSIMRIVTAHPAAVTNPLPPVQNKIFDSLVGHWKGESVMNGVKMKDRVNIKWALNHQYIIWKLESKSINDKKMQYNGFGVFGVDKSGKVKVWWFDDRGPQNMSTGEGAFDDHGFTIQQNNDFFKGTRSFSVMDKTLIMKDKGIITLQGKKMFYDETITYKRRIF